MSSYEGGKNMNNQTTAMEPTRYSQVATKEETDAIQRVMLRMVSGGFTSEGKELNNAHRFAIAAVAAKYELDPLLGEVYLLGGNVYLSAVALKRMARDSGRIKRGWETRPATPDERIAHECDDDEMMWVARVWIDDQEHPFVGYGYGSYKDVAIARNSHSKRILRNVVEKRALTRALRDALGVNAHDPEDFAQDVVHSPLTKTATSQVSCPTPVALPAPVETKPVLEPAIEVTPEPVAVAVAVPAPVVAPEPKAIVASAQAETAPLDATSSRYSAIELSRIGYYTKRVADSDWAPHISRMMDAAQQFLDDGGRVSDGIRVMERLCKAADGGASPQAIFRVREIAAVLEAGGIDATEALALIVIHNETDALKRVELLIEVDRLGPEDAEAVLIQARQTENNAVATISKAVATIIMGGAA